MGSPERRKEGEKLRVREVVLIGEKLEWGETREKEADNGPVKVQVITLLNFENARSQELAILQFPGAKQVPMVEEIVILSLLPQWMQQ